MPARRSASATGGLLLQLRETCPRLCDFRLIRRVGLGADRYELSERGNGFIAFAESFAEPCLGAQSRRREATGADVHMVPLDGVERALIVAQSLPEVRDEKISRVQHEVAVRRNIDEQRIQLSEPRPCVRRLPRDRQMRRE